MSTSLQEQLQRLAVPQTKTLADARSRVSILFDRDEASKKPRRTIYEIGLSGLQELAALNPIFHSFEATLFEETTVDLERAVEDSEFNKLLDRNIWKFTRHLSPFFLLRPTHMCLEWLLRRYHIHEYNRDALMALALPYHETNTFVLVLQTMRLKPSDSMWGWLKPLHKPGVPLPKSAIINRASSNPAFLKFICSTTLEAVKELGPRANILQTQINFYTSVVVGALEQAEKIQEWHLIAILPSILNGFKSEVMDFAAASYIVATQLVARTPITTKLCNGFIERVAAVSLERLRSTAVLLLVFIFETQAGANPEFSEPTLIKLIKQKWFINVLSTLAKDRVYVYSLCASMLKASVAAIHSEHADIETFKKFLEQLLNDVEFDTASAQEIINAFLNSFVSTGKNEESMPDTVKEVKDGDVIELESDDEMSQESAGFQAWYADYMRKLERKYPTAFDMAVKEALQANTEESATRKEVLKMALGFRLKSLDSNVTDMYENLYHHTANIRVCAIQTLLANLNNYRARPQNYQLLKECLADRIVDDSELVVEEVLKLATREFIEVLGVDKFVESLFSILSKIQQDPEHWAQLTQALVQHLTTQEVVERFDTNVILLSLMPLLFPDDSTNTTREAIASIIKSPLREKIGFLKSLKLDDVKKGKDFSATEFKKQFLNVISSVEDTPDVMALFKSAETHSTKILGNSLQFSHFLMLVTACLKSNLTGADCSYIFLQVERQCQHFRIKHLDNQQWKLVKEQKIIPLQLFADFITTLVRQTRFHELQNWTQNSVELKNFLNILELLTNQTFEQTNMQEQLEWFKTLKEVLDTVFETAQSKLEFLLNFYIYAEFNLVPAYATLRLRAFKLLHALLKNKKHHIDLNSEHILKISIALNSQSEVTRLQVLETLKVAKENTDLSINLRQFVDSMLERSYEIGMDHEQFPLILYTVLKPAHKKHKHIGMTRMLQDIVKVATAENALDNAVFTAEILKTLKHINDDQILGNFIPLAVKALEKAKSDGALKLLNRPYSQIFQLVCERFDSQNIENVLIECPEAWQFIEKTFNNHNIFIPLPDKLQSIACIALETFDEHTYEKMPNKYKIELIKLIIKTVAEAENDTIFLTANKVLKRCTLNCAPLRAVLEQMFVTAEQTKAAKRKSLQSGKRDNTNVQAQVNTLSWKQGVVLLELLENKKKLIDTAQIIPALFDLVRICLEMEEQSAVEYTKQLALSTLFHCCQLAKMEGVDLLQSLPKSIFRIDLIVQCVRATQNPQTQHNALLLLSYCAALFPHQVLHNIVDIFTFMGSSVVRHDDAFSFHVINNVIESIIPILVNEKHKGKSADNVNANALVIPVLKVFSDILLDVPEHRRQPLYTKLLLTLGAEQYLWVFLCIVFEAHVIDDEKQRLLQKKSKPSPTPATVAEKFAKRIEICMELVNAFEPQTILETCIQLLDYIKGLPLNKESAIDSGSVVSIKKSTTNVDSTEITLFDVKSRTAKQLRHYKYLIMQFLSTISNSSEFLRKIALLSEEQQLAIKPFYQNFIIKTLSYVPIVTNAIEKAEEPSQNKFWKVILHHLHDVLDNAISLLSPDMFLIVVHGLMQHQLLSVRRKVIELLISKLQQRDSYFDTCEEQNFHNLLEPLRNIVTGLLQEEDNTSTQHSNELVFLQQTALIAVKLLSKMFALKYIDEFKELLVQLNKIIKNRANISKIVLATVVLTTIEISSNLKAHSLAHLPKYMPQLIEVLRQQVELVHNQAPDNVCVAIITGMQKLFETLPLFLGPYVMDIITALSTISTYITEQHNEKDQRSAAVLHKINTIWTKIATEVPVRVLVPSCEKAYKKLMDTKHYADIGVLMKLLPECIGNCSSSDLLTVQMEFNNFFLHTLEFRLQVQQECDSVCISTTEAAIIDAFVAWVLKLSESSFRPICRKVYDWALKETAQKETILTYFSLTNKIAEALKSLFVLFAGDFVDDAANLLNKYNSTKNDIEPSAEKIITEIIKAILSTLYNLFLHDSKGFINNRRFDVLMQPIVDQLENCLVLEDEALQQTLIASIAQLAVVVSNDVMWKQLNYQVLLKTRTNVPEVRILSFNCCLEIARKLGEDFTPLLPETVPFVAELLEDENQRVEKNTRKAVQELEAILGESLQL